MKYKIGTRGSKLALAQTKQVIEKLKSGELKIETCPQVEVDSELTEEYIIKQLESYQRLLDSGIIDEASKEEQGPVKKLITNNKK